MNTVAVLTLTALERLAAGGTLNFAGSDLFELNRSADNVNYRAIYCRGDLADAQLLVMGEGGRSDVLPAPLRQNRDAAYERIISFVQRSATMPVTLPRGWKQFKSNNLIAFFALPEAIGSSSRWVTEVRVQGSPDIAFWKVTDTDDREELERFVTPTDQYSAATEFWREMRSSGLEALGEAVSRQVDVDVRLDPAPQVQGLVKSRAFTQWLPDLTKSQTEFVEAPTDHSIRLRGPAGSGKTLTMGIKAVREVTRARREGQQLRVLFVTHSWSLAGEVDALLTALSEEGNLGEINVLPLVAVAQEILPSGMVPADLSLIGDDSLSGKRTQLGQIREIVDEFIAGDWITFKNRVSGDLVERFEDETEAGRRGLAWDLLVEFGCVLGGDGIFPGVNGEQRYKKLHRAPWMMRLSTENDRRAVYAMYEMYHRSLQERNLISTDQLLNDFLNYLESFTWNHRRLKEGYDLIFADEYHLFNALERQVLRFLGRDVRAYPRIFMAQDPRQSPWDVFYGPTESTTRDESGVEDESVQTVDIPTVHRSSPQILELIKHIHLDYANLSLDDDWDYSISDVESLGTPGPVPTLYTSSAFAEEEDALLRAIAEIYPRSHGGAQIALAIVDEDLYRNYRSVISTLGKAGKYSVVSVTSREDVGALKYAKRGIVVGPAEYLAGLQFDTVLVAGLPSMNSSAPNQGVRRRGALSLLYLAVSRASREVRLFSNEDFGGVPDVLARAHDEGVLGQFSSVHQSRP